VNVDDPFNVEKQFSTFKEKAVMRQISMLTGASTLRASLTLI
jgi:hypothetical protein